MNDTRHVRICFGMTLYNRSDYLPEALESLLNQSYRDFRIIAIDDCSNDATEEVMHAYAKRDDRISYFRNPNHEGMISTWRKAFFKAFETYRPEYFAWASDHDRWDARWLELHIAALDAHPDSVLAYPDAAAINDSGEALDIEIPPFIDTHEKDLLDHLFQVGLHLRGAGYAVYGLFRTDPLLKAGIFRRVILPDRLLLTEISAYGKFFHIPEVLWYRRFLGPVLQLTDVINVQKERLFGRENIPFHIHTPFLSHVVALLVNLVLDQSSRKSLMISRGLILAGLVWEKRRKYIIKEIDRLLSEEISSSFFGQEAKVNPQKYHWLVVLVLVLQLIRDRNLQELGPFYQIAVKALSLPEWSKPIDDAPHPEPGPTQAEDATAEPRLTREERWNPLPLHEVDIKNTVPMPGPKAVWELLEALSRSVARENELQNDLRLNLLKSHKKIESLRRKSLGLKEKVENIRRENEGLKQELEALKEEKELLEAEKNFWKKKGKIGIGCLIGQFIEAIFSKDQEKK